MIKTSPRLDKVHSDIRGPLFIEALKMEAEGTPVLKLNTGNPGKFGFGLPDSLRRALLEKMDEAVAYCDVKGMPEARRAILNYHIGKGVQNVGMDDIFIGNGVSEIAQLIMDAMIGPGDEILLPSPNYSLWSNNTFLSGGTAVFYRCDPKNKWNPDIADIKSKITSRTKAILVINPNNPTGVLYSEDVLLEIADIARKNGLVLMADEIYDRLCMDGLEHKSLAALAPDVPCITFNGLSKSHIVCGFRCGWMILSAPDHELDDIKAGVQKLAAMRLCSNTLTQLCIPAALADNESTRAMMVPGGRLYEQRAATVAGLEQIEGVDFTVNNASFYIFPGLDQNMYDFRDAPDFSMKFLHEKHVLVIPGTGFDWHEDLRFRIVMLPQPERIAQAMADLKEFLHDHRK